MKSALFGLAALSLTKAQTVVIQGGHISNTFAQCGTYSCTTYARCCNVQLPQYNFNQNMCIETSLTQGYNTGIYMDTVNYPYAQYTWDCSPHSGQPAETNDEPEPTHQDLDISDVHTRLMCNGLPADICNDWNWFWTWAILLVYLVSGGGWVLGYFLFFPFTIANNIYHFIAGCYAFTVWAFQGRITAEQFFLYPVRRHWIQVLIQTLGYIVLLIPGVSALMMPLLGTWALNDYLDYQGWDQVGFTLGIPFNQPTYQNYEAMAAAEKHDALKDY